jgi:hypothetical protein
LYTVCYEYYTKNPKWYAAGGVYNFENCAPGMSEIEILALASPFMYLSVRV